MKNKAEKGEKLMERVEPLGLKFALLDRKFRKLIETKASDLGFTAVQLSVLALLLKGLRKRMLSPVFLVIRTSVRNQLIFPKNI